MIKSFLKLADNISWITARLAYISVIVLVSSMIYEVTARYFLNAPTVWSYDIAYMSSGALFILGVSWTLRENAHIRIDIIRNMLPKRVGNIIESLVYLLILTPLFFSLFQIAIKKTINAWVTQEVEMVSPWAPLMWPYYLILAVGLGSLALQLAAQSVRGLFNIERKDVEQIK